VAQSKPATNRIKERRMTSREELIKHMDRAAGAYGELARGEQYPEVILEWDQSNFWAWQAARALESTAEDIAKAWDEGNATGSSRAMRHMSDEPALSITSPNPYRANPGQEK
jgi:cytochrome c556